MSMSLVAIKTKSAVYISKNAGNKDFFTFPNGYLFDGQEARKTFESNWYELDKLPTKVECIVKGGTYIKHWTLKEGYISSESFPMIIDVQYDITDKYDEDNEYLEISALYEKVIEKTEDTRKEVEFTVDVIEEFEGEWKFVEKPYKAEYGLLDKITVHPAFLQDKPCKLSMAESYTIIRNYVKENINLKVARITSDYDFCLTVTKYINLNEPEPYKETVGTGKRAKVVVKFRDTRPIKVLEVAPKPYQNYPVVVPFEGTSYENMMENIEKYLKNLIDEINEPMYDCPCCKGKGVVTKTQRDEYCEKVGIRKD